MFDYNILFVGFKKLFVLFSWTGALGPPRFAGVDVCVDGQTPQTPGRNPNASGYDKGKIRKVVLMKKIGKVCQVQNQK